MSDGNGEEREPRLVRLALDLVAFCDRIEPKILRRRKVAINGQLQDAASSTLANAGEAWDEPNPREKRRFLHYALRSGGECQRELRGAFRAAAISSEELAEGLRLVLYFKLDALRLIRWCENQIPH